MKTLKTAVIVLFALFMTSNMVSADEVTSTGFYCPTGTDGFVSYAGWLAVPPEYIAGKYHIGYDIAADLGDAVYAISDGVVIDINNGPYSGWGSGNLGVFIRHTLEDGSQFVALYGHVVPSVGENSQVNAGDQIGTIGAYSRPHLHFGVHIGGARRAYTVRTGFWENAQEKLFNTKK